MRCRTAAPTTTYTEQKQFRKERTSVGLLPCYVNRAFVSVRQNTVEFFLAQSPSSCYKTSCYSVRLFFVSIDGVSSDINLVKKRCKCLYEKDST